MGKRMTLSVVVKTTGRATVKVSATAAKGKGKRSKAPGPLQVTLPDLPTVPEEYRGREYTVNPQLLGDPDSNPKIAKSNGAGEGFLSWGLSLSPAHESGYQTCASASPGCMAACLYRQGRGQCPSIAAARIAKTIALMEHRDWFKRALRAELERVGRKARKEGKRAAVRLNVLSDIQWEKLAPWIFEEFTDVQFYDYTKHRARMLSWCRGELPSNYHLTFSRSECNESDALAVLAAGGNVSVVFRDADYPQRWCGYPVVNGDETDLRFLDGSNVVVGLYAKGSGKHDTSGFVVNTRTPLLMTK